MTAYYNERDPYAAAWLRNLIAAGHVAPGEVDERSITEVSADDLEGFTQCHFFAGIGVWSHALRRAGWDDDRPVWTGSCPCQPFSAAGKQAGFSDERHLWPVWFRLIAERRPPVVLGEQVASALDWLDLVSAYMEGEDYAFGSSDLCAAGFGGAHIRQRLYFVGLDHTASSRHDREVSGAEGSPRDETRLRLSGEKRGLGGLAESDCGQRRGFADGEGCQPNRQTAGREQGDGELAASGELCGLGRPAGHAPMLGRHAADWLFCRDGKWRPVEPRTFPLADAAPSRVGRLRAYGNALDAETATEFIAAVIETLPMLELLS